MDRSDIVTLLKTTYAADDYGVERATITGRDVFCAVQSVTRNEFFEGGRNGLNPEYRVTMFYGDYEGETLADKTADMLMKAGVTAEQIAVIRAIFLEKQ